MVHLSEQLEVTRPLLRGVSADVPRARLIAPTTRAEFPHRPDRRFLSESIPLFFIGRNKFGLWVAREAEGRAGGTFLLKRSALRFAAKYSAPAGCATMLLNDRFELDVQNQGNPLIVALEGIMRMIGRQRRGAAAHAVAVAMGGNQRGGRS